MYYVLEMIDDVICGKYKNLHGEPQRRHRVTQRGEREINSV
jgi:hypothetical protein